MRKTYKAIIENDSEKIKILYLEPWGEDYVMKPKDIFEIIEDEVENVYFHIVFGESISVYVEGNRHSYPRVYQDGEELELGHNRELLKNCKIPN